MPGLRSLVARRRCSLPSSHIASTDSIVCAFPSVPGAISSRKGNSLDDRPLLQKENATANNSEDGIPKWDLKTLFEIEDESLSTTLSHFSNKSVQKSEINSSEKENNMSFNMCNKNAYEPTVISSNDNDSKNLSCNEFSEDFESKSEVSSNKTSPERIVIKMKLLHGSSLTDVTNISESPCSNEIPEKSDFALIDGKPSRSKTQWTIDSILNQPVHLQEKYDCNSYCNSHFLVESHRTNEDDKETSNEEFVGCNGNGNANNFNCGSNVEVTEEDSKEPCIQKSDGNSFLTKETDKNASEKVLKTNFYTETGITDRRPSNSSDASEDSICSETSMASSTSVSSSGSSVKSCSIVIKRLENSDTYSCFQSPKSKRKKYQDSLSKAIYIKRGKTLPVLYIQKKVLHPNKPDILPCSVILCDIFSNYPFKIEVCPKCLNSYDIPADLFVNICSRTLTLQCCACKWIVVRSLILKEVDLQIQPLNC